MLVCPYLLFGRGGFEVLFCFGSFIDLVLDLCHWERIWGITFHCSAGSRVSVNGVFRLDVREHPRGRIRPWTLNIYLKCIDQKRVDSRLALAWNNHIVFIYTRKPSCTLSDDLIVITKAVLCPVAAAARRNRTPLPPPPSHKCHLTPLPSFLLVTLLSPIFHLKKQKQKNIVLFPF